MNQIESVDQQPVKISLRDISKNVQPLFIMKINNVNGVTCEIFYYQDDNSCELGLKFIHHFQLPFRVLNKVIKLIDMRRTEVLERLESIRQESFRYSDMIPSSQSIDVLHGKVQISNQTTVINHSTPHNPPDSQTERKSETSNNPMPRTTPTVNTKLPRHDTENSSETSDDDWTNTVVIRTPNQNRNQLKYFEDHYDTSTHHNATPGNDSNNLNTAINSPVMVQVPQDHGGGSINHNESNSSSANAILVNKNQSQHLNDNRNRDIGHHTSSPSDAGVFRDVDPYESKIQSTDDRKTNDFMNRSLPRDYKGIILAAFDC
jgi:hypothetical protein